jgi:hypothetical protein
MNTLVRISCVQQGMCYYVRAMQCVCVFVCEWAYRSFINYSYTRLQDRGNLSDRRVDVVALGGWGVDCSCRL